LRKEIHLDKQTFLQSVKSTRAELEAALGRVAESRMAEPGVSGVMSVKDIIAHIAWFENEMVDLLENRTLAGSDLWDLPSDDRNAVIYDMNQGRSQEDIRQEAMQVYEQFSLALETLEDEELHDPTRFRNMPADWVPWQLLAENSSEHYEDHTADIRKWLEKG
jgi:hypothetical protein